MWVPGASPPQGLDRGRLRDPGARASGRKTVLAKGPILAVHSGLCRGNRLLPGEGAREPPQLRLQPRTAPAGSRPLIASLLLGQYPAGWVQGGSQSTHPSLGGFWASSPFSSPGGCSASALTTAGPKPRGGEKQEPRAPKLLKRGVLHPPTRARAIGRLSASSFCRPVTLAARCARTWASRSGADLEALAQVNPSNPLIPGTEIGKISRSVGKALGQS